MITKVAKNVIAEMSDDEAEAMRRTHLIKGLVSPVTVIPAGAVGGGLAAAGIGALAGKLLKLPPEKLEKVIDTAGESGIVGGGLGGVGWGVKELLGYGATKEELEREKANRFGARP